MYGKVLVASGAVYLLTFEAHTLPVGVGAGILVASGVIVATDIMDDGPQHRLERFIQRAGERMQRSTDRMEQKIELQRIAREELAANHGIRMAEELTDDDREWLREQAAMTIQHYDGAR